MFDNIFVLLGISALEIHKMLILLVKFLIGFIQLLIFGFLFSDAYHLGKGAITYFVVASCSSDSTSSALSTAAFTASFSL